MELPTEKTTVFDIPGEVFTIYDRRTPSTTEVVYHTKPSQQYQITKGYAFIIIAEFTAKPKEYTKEEFPTTGSPTELITDVFTPTRKYEVYCLYPTTIKVLVNESHVQTQTSDFDVTTETGHFTPSDSKVTQEVTPTTSRIVTFTMSEHTISDEVNTPTVVVFTPTIKETPDIQVITPTSQIQRNVTIPIYIVIIQYPKAATYTVTQTPAGPALFTDVVTPTTVYESRITPPSEKVSTEVQQTTIKVIIKEKAEQYLTRTQPLETTATDVLIPTVGTFSEIIPDIVPSISNIPVETATETDEVYQPTTMTETFQPQTPTIYDLFTRTTKKCVHKKVTPDVNYHTRTPPFIFVWTFTPQDHHPTFEKRTRSTVNTISFPIQTMTDYDFQKDTTEEEIIIQPRTTEDQDFSKEVPTNEYEFTPEGWSDYDIVTPSTTERITRYPPTGRQTWYPHTPKTSSYQFTPPEETMWTDWMTPTSFTFDDVPIVTTEVLITRPPDRTTSFTVIPDERTSTDVFLPETQTFQPSPSTYKCTYTPTTPQPPVTSCNKISRVKEKCTKEVLNKWTAKIQNCATKKLKQKGIAIKIFVESKKNPNIKILEKIVIDCIKIIGDTTCRNNSFNLLQEVIERDIQVINEEDEEYWTGKPVTLPDDRLHFEVKKCIALINDEKMMQCSPDVLKALKAVIGYGRINIKLEVNQPQGCIIRNLKHCDHEVRVTIEKLVEKITGKCIKFTAPGEESVCDDERQQKKCKKEVVDGFIKALKKCVRLEHSEESSNSKEKLLKIAAKCVSKHRIQSCLIYTCQGLMRVLNTVKGSIESYGKDECTAQLVSKDLRNCMEKLSILVPTLNSLEDTNRPLQLIQKCCNTALDSCPADFTKGVIDIVASIVGVVPSHVPTESPPQTITSITVADDNVKICVKTYRTKPADFSTEPTFPDDCVEADDTGDTHVLVKSCRSKEVLGWMKKLRSCVDGKVAKIGLRNPEFLSINRVLNIMESCISQQGTIRCRPKYQAHFDTLIRATLNMVKQNTWCSKQKGLRDKLDVESLSRCMPVLHKYLVLSTDSSFRALNRDKSMQCVQRSLSDFPKPVMKKLLDLMGNTFILDSGSSQKYEECDPSGFTPAYHDLPNDNSMCGNEGMRKRRDLTDSEDGEYEYVDENEISDSNSVPIEDLNNAEEETIKKPEACTSTDFRLHSEKLIECGEKKLRWKFKQHRDKCLFGNLKESWIALIGCLFDTDDFELTCTISSKDQLTQFLEHTTTVLNVNRQLDNQMCKHEDFCYQTSSPTIDSCSEIFYQLLEPTNNFSRILSILKPSLSCVSLLWPNCPIQVPLMTLPFIYIPLGFSSTIMDGMNFTYCNAEDFNMPSEPPPQCQDGEKNKEILTLEQDLSHCTKCLPVRHGTCIFSSISEMFQVLEPGLTRIRQCLKNIVTITDDCITEITKRVKETCLPTYYTCAKSIQDGDTPDIVEYCWKFYKCIYKTPLYCPEEFAQFVPEIYGRILGVNSILKL